MAGKRIILPKSIVKEIKTEQFGGNPPAIISNEGIDLFNEIQEAIDDGTIIVSGGGGSDEANLSLGTITSTSIPIDNDNGTGVVLPPVNTSQAGLMTPTDKIKLDGLTQYTHPNHIGDVTSTGDGATIISANSVSNTKLVDMPANTVKTRNQNTSGDPVDMAVPTNSLVGRNAGNIVPITLGSNLSMTGDVLNSTGGVSDGDKTDINVAGDVWQIKPNVVGFNEIQQINTDKLLGRDTAGLGNVEEIGVNGGVEFDGSGNIRTSALTGDVTKAAGGTVTTISNDAVTNQKLANMPANTIKGNNTGAAGDPLDLTPSQVKAMLSFNASDIVNTPSGNIASTNVQAALNELDGEKNVRIQFQDEGVDLGADDGNVDTVNFTGAGVVATRLGNIVTVDITSGGGGGGMTNLTEGTRTATTVGVNSDTGSDATLNPATNLLAGVMPAGDKVKVDHITVTQAVNLDTIEAHVAGLVALTGVAALATDLGTFTGTIIPDNQNVKQALQALETNIEANRNSINGIQGNGSSGTPFKLGAVLTEDTIINGNALYDVFITDTDSIFLEANDGAGAKSNLFLTTSLANGALLHSETAASASVFAEIRVDPDGAGTRFVQQNAGAYSGVLMTSPSSASLVTTDGVNPVNSFETNVTDHFIKGLKSLSQTDIVYIDPVTGIISYGSAPSGIFEYNIPITGGNAGSSLRIVATQTGITASFASNVLTLSAPTGSNRILSADWRLVAADIQASADAGGSSNWIRVVFQGTGGNTGVSDLRIPTVQKSAIPTSGTIALTNAISIDLDNNPAISVVAVGTGSITMRVAGIAAGSQGYHLKFTNI